MMSERQEGFLRSETLVLVLLLLASLGVLGWVFVQMYRQSKVHVGPEVAAQEASATNGVGEGRSLSAVVQEVRTGKWGEGKAEVGSESGSGGVERVEAELAMYSNMIATLRAEMALMAERQERERAEALAKLHDEVRQLREALAQQQTQAFLAERELIRANLQVDSAQEALRCMEKELRAKEEEIQRLRGMVEELSGVKPPMFRAPAVTNAAREMGGGVGVGEERTIVAKGEEGSREGGIVGAGGEREFERREKQVGVVDVVAPGPPRLGEEVRTEKTGQGGGGSRGAVGSTGVGEVGGGRAGEEGGGGAIERNAVSARSEAGEVKPRLGGEGNYGKREAGEEAGMAKGEGEEENPLGVVGARGVGMNWVEEEPLETAGRG
ncbi:MAG: hypothetical protein N2595_03830, partial [bacterium]|nr:hypothetical protein [bacterium]